MKPLFLESTGCRYLITRQGGGYWTGEDWSENRSEGTLYYAATDAAEDCADLLRRGYDHCRVVANFTVPIEIEVRSEQPIDFDDLRKWLRDAVNTQVAYGEY